MSAQVNSPFLLAKIRPVKELTRQENNYHDQIERILQQLYRRVGGETDIIDEDDSGIEILPRLLSLELRVSSGYSLTSDDTGFTVDSDKLTVDQDEA
jgi:hypothetical protein